ncbi:MAG: helix-turn-helix transcriptional regulator [Bacteroidaceae bacterium]|nr:helix-turn-helix transcriptional regulator [Bacteroidaceae bacterium]
MENLLSENVKRICKERKIQLKELARNMDVDPASLTRALNGNARLDTIQKIATALGVSMKSLFEPMDDVEGFIRIRGKAYQFNSRAELDKLLNNEDEVKRQEGNNYDRV